MPERITHIVDSRDLPRGWIEDFFEESKRMKDAVKSKRGFQPEDKMGCAIFDEPSNITLRSFQRAIGHLRWTPLSSPEVRERSMWPSTPQREIEVLNAIGFNFIIVRNPEAGYAKSAAEYSKVPVFNAGESFRGNRFLHPSEHPTQVLADIDLIKSHHGKLDSLRMAIVGDPRGNPVVNSLLFIATKFEIEIVLVSKGGRFALPVEVETHLSEHKTSITKTADLHSQLPYVDVVYFAPPASQTLNSITDHYEDLMGEREFSLLPKGSIVLSDMLRGKTPPIIDDPRFIEELQIENGVYARMAMMKMLVSP